MKIRPKTNWLFVLVLVVPIALAADIDHPGYVDLDNLAGWGSADAVVDVNLGSWLLNLARSAAAESDDTDLAFLSSLDNVRVRVFRNVDPTMREQVTQLVADLSSRGWEAFAKVRDEEDTVDILVKGNAGQLDGITVVAIGDDQEAVLLNIAGRIDPKDVAKILDDNDLLQTNLNLDL